MTNNWKQQINELGKPEWRAMLLYVADLHETSTHPAESPFPYDWEEIGPGYCYAPTFGHWDITHALLDQLPYSDRQTHVKNQLLNYLSFQRLDGMFPATVCLVDGMVKWNRVTSHPPLWPIVLHEYVERYGDKELLEKAYKSLVLQLGWFESNRKAEHNGYFYTDILNHSWESGIDDGVRFDSIQTGPYACVDATAHVQLACQYAADWASRLNQEQEAEAYREKAAYLANFMRNELFDTQTGLFHDIWAVNQPHQRRLAMEGMWPMITGAATFEQRDQLIDENLLEPTRFFTKHPLPSVALSDPMFELRCWRGPAWNSMTYWAAWGCSRNGRPDAAVKLLERALDASAEQFALTGTIWEFYHPQGEAPTLCQRKPYTPYNEPCPDYLGHNPVIGMALLWEQLRRSES